MEVLPHMPNTLRPFYVPNRSRMRHVPCVTCYCLTVFIAKRATSILFQLEQLLPACAHPMSSMLV